jgi:multicomponent Na+:H+ antiporter subunit C
VSPLVAVPDAVEVTLAPTGSSVLIAVLIRVLFSTGTYLILQRALTRIIVGLGLITHAANLMLLTAGGRPGDTPFVQVDGQAVRVPEGVADPLPQAMALTAIVISFAVTALLLALTYRSMVLVHDDAVQDDPEDRRILQRTEPAPDRKADR